ncbi:MAG: UvrB/UvrC motif-containing protein [Planctomycetes bacterium]|nr:UvrB/UvrC motif-containing protein [Planctomycetota bacterium]
MTRDGTRMRRLREAVRRMPSRPGVYVFRDGRGMALYVGMSRSLRQRVGSYLHGVPEDPRIARMVSQARSVEARTAASEVEAMLLEARLVREMRPRYNRMLLDDKSFPRLRISGDPYPLVAVTRDPPRKGDREFGPFVDAGGLNRSLALLQPVFRFRTCEIDIDPDDPKRRFFRPCLLYSIQRCTAPCNGSISPEAYARDIRGLVRFLEGDRSALLPDFRKRMKDASAALRYEEAAEWRDRIRALESLDRRGPLSNAAEAAAPFLRPADGLGQLREILGLESEPRVVEGVDIATVHGEASVGSLVRFAGGIPDKSGYRRFRIRTVKGMNDPAMIAEVVRRRFRRLLAEGAALPDILLVDGGRSQLNAATAVLDSFGVKGVTALGLAKREEEIHRLGGGPLRLSRHAPALRLLQHVRDEAHRFAGHYHHLLRSRAIRAR